VVVSGLKLAYDSEVPGALTNRHLITNLSDGVDPKITAEKIPMVAPGSKHSIRIGSTVSGGGGTFDRIKTSFVVTPSNTLFQYQFALVLQNDNRHADYQKSGFSIDITDNDGQPLSCNFFGVQLQNGGTSQGFKLQGDLEYKNWTTGAIDLRNYIGKIINAEVTAHGCTGREHFGYAYFDAQCLKTEVKIASFCPDEDGFMTIIAPEGFDSYLWNNGATTARIKVKANVGDRYTVKVSPLEKLDASCSFQLDYKIPYTATDTTITATICEGESFKVANKTYKNSGVYVNKITRGNVCDSTIKLNLTVIPIAKHQQSFTICEGKSITVGDSIYTKTGIYVNHIIRASGCDSVITTYLTVEDFQLVMPLALSITEGENVNLALNLQPVGVYTIQWNPPTGLSCATCATTTANPSASTQYVVTVKNASQACTQTEKVKITVLPCNIYVPDIFSPNGDQQNDIFFVYGNSCVRQIKEMVVYDRWGEIIFQKSNFQASDPQQGWDGRYLGNIAVENVYAYKIWVEFNSGKISKYMGSVTLLR